MRLHGWDSLLTGIVSWFEASIKPLLGGEDHTIDKFREEAQELIDAVALWEDEGLQPDKLAENRMHVAEEAADVLISLLCYCHANGINLHSAAAHKLLLLRERKWERSSVPGVVRHVD